MTEEPNYSRLAARLLSTVIDKEVANQDVHSFSQSVAAAHGLGSSPRTRPASSRAIAQAQRRYRHRARRALRVLRPSHGLRPLSAAPPRTTPVIETPQYFFLRVACGLATSPDEAIELYRLMSSLEYLPSSPTLFNSGTTHPQMSSCYLLDSPRDELESIYERYGDVARCPSSPVASASRSTACARGARSSAAPTGSPTGSCRG